MMRKSFFADIMGQKYLLMQLKFSMKSCWRQDFIPKEFNRKMRPLGELSYWKAADFRLFALYAGICILKNKDILSKEKYLHYLHFAAALRLLISAQTTDSDMTVCSSLLSTFVTKCSALWLWVLDLQCTQLNTSA